MTEQEFPIGLQTDQAIRESEPYLKHKIYFKSISTFELEGYLERHETNEEVFSDECIFALIDELEGRGDETNSYLR